MSSVKRKDPELSYSLKGHKSPILSADYTPDGKQLVSGASDGSIILWDLDPDIRQPMYYRLVGHQDTVHCVNCSPSNNYILSSSRDRTVRLWKLNNGRIQGSSMVYKCHGTTVRCVHSSPDSLQFCTASDDKTVKLWSAMYVNKYLCSFTGHTNWVRSCRFAGGDKNLIASCGDDARICVFDVRVKTAAQTIVSKIASHFNCVSWYPNHSTLLAVASQDGCIRIYDLRTCKLLQYYAVHLQAVHDISFHPSGHYLFSASSDETSKMFDLLEGRVLYTFRNHKGSVLTCSFSGDGKQMVTAGSDKVIYVWDCNLDAGLVAESTLLSEAGNGLLSEKAKYGVEVPYQVILDETHTNLDNLEGDTIVREGGDPVLDWCASPSNSLISSLIAQISSLTDAVASIETRLVQLEKRFDAHCTRCAISE